MAATIAIGLAFWFVLTLQCQPVSYFWHRVGSGRCLDLNTVVNMAYVSSAIAALCDLTLGLLPIFLVWNLQMNQRTKVVLACILGMGCV
jgi:outer membrane receptor for Fe3+-dicitrate